MTPTSVHLKAAKKSILAKAIQAAWRNTAPKAVVNHARMA
jgi:hypothetical protein